MPQSAIQKTADKSFADFYLSEKTLQAIAEIGYQKPTPVQAQSIPLVIAGIDLTVMSQTGTGKTAAFAIPIIEIVDPTPGQIDVLVLAPTRELAIQVSREFEKLGKFKGIEVATIYGGTSYEKQYQEIEKATVVVATPGRLIDLIDHKKCDLSTIKHFVLDEADEMLSMGFAEALDKIIEFLPEDRQSLLFSATITNEVRSLAKKLLFYPEFISMSDDSVAARNVTHVWYPVRGVGRTRELLRIIEFEQPEQAIVFANTKTDTVKISDSLNKHGIKARVINGDLPQRAREEALKQLRNKEFEILVATDVAARGIDISGLTHVFNYVVPESAEVYIHRAGRTGRAGSKGRAISLISPAEFPTLHTIKKHYGVTPEMSVVPTTHQVIEAKRQKHLIQLSEKLSNDFDLPYGAKLGLAHQLVKSANDDSELAVKLIARLLTLSDTLGKEKAAVVVQKTTAVAEPVIEEKVDVVEVVEKPTPKGKEDPKPATPVVEVVAEKRAATPPTPTEPTPSVTPEPSATPDTPTRATRVRLPRRQQSPTPTDTPTHPLAERIPPASSYATTATSTTAHSPTTEHSPADAHPLRAARLPAATESHTRTHSHTTTSSPTTTPTHATTSSHTPSHSPATTHPHTPTATRAHTPTPTPAKRVDEVVMAAPEHSDDQPRTSRRRRRRGRTLEPTNRRVRGGEDVTPADTHTPKQNNTSRPHKERERESFDYVSTRNSHLPFEKTEFNYKRMWINLGASICPNEDSLRKALIFLSGFGSEDFGPLFIESTFSYVDVREDYFDDILYALNEQQWEGHFIAVEAARK